MATVDYFARGVPPRLVNPDVWPDYQDRFERILDPGQLIYRPKINTNVSKLIYILKMFVGKSRDLMIFPPYILNIRTCLVLS